MNNDYKHVCFKDLEGYFKKSDYFSGLTDFEKDQIKANLGLGASNDLLGTYKEIKTLADNGKLILGNIYIINDFQTIYKLNGEVMGLVNTKCPSKNGILILTAVSEKAFNPSGIVVYDKVGYDIKYDITSETFGTVSTKGTITYMEDSNNNSAHYDFKNIRFKRTVEELKNSTTSYTSDQYFYTFDDGQGEDNSNNVRNNTLNAGVTNVVFLKDAENNTLEADCHDITFLDIARNNVLYFSSMNTIFTNIVQQIRGTVKNRTITNITEGTFLKEFYNSSDSQICVYYDPTTQTFLTEIL